MKEEISPLESTVFLCLMLHLPTGTPRGGRTMTIFLYACGRLVYTRAMPIRTFKCC
jgi:hypothetical protein